MPDNQDYTAVTEVTGYNVTSEQIQRMYTRYRFASEFCKDKDVLEVACGSGQWLGYLAEYTPLAAITAVAPVTSYKVIFCVGQKK
ncbi:MAG: hypothetical protein CVU77_01900 [Elusimicrobia bacterium HGW-Elusimicrobia-1]|jgi:ubiquinone/menaquinone biosynthesis C-methylase UbiE|nr:MAG: hypothetical protein CVU77_01900 [Elusimicrobia bacterium HGW-Elusimicrobia-1]